MSSDSKINKPKSTAMDELTEAFLRLKTNQPIRLPYGTKVSQNNVAREAGKEPSAFKKTRYPKLIQEIQTFLKTTEVERPETNKAKKARQQNKYNLLKGKYEAIKLQRDNLANQMNAANAKILELTFYVKELENKMPNSKIQPLMLERSKLKN